MINLAASAIKPLAKTAEDLISSVIQLPQSHGVQGKSAFGQILAKQIDGLKEIQK